MFERFNPWQRFWGLFALLMLVSTLVVAIAIWPRADTDLVADLAAPACAEWRDRLDGGSAEAVPAASAQCGALRAFVTRHREPLRSVAEYDAWRVRIGVNQVTKVLLFWAASVAALYLFGWAGASVSGRFLRRQQTSAVTTDVSGGAVPRDSHG